MANQTSIGIIGTGWVGSSVAVSTLHAGAAREVLLWDQQTERAEAEAMDLAQGSSFYPAASVRVAPPDEMASCDAVVVAAGRGGKPGESRLDLLRDNARIVRELAGQFRGYPGVVVMVTNPVDVLTAVFQAASGLPPERELGTGTMLDTARLRQTLGRELRLDPRSVHAQVVGEHGDSEVVLWSSAQAGGAPLRQWPGWRPEREPQVAEEVRTAAYEIIRRKGATNHAIGLVTAALLRWLMRGERRVLTVSRVQTEVPGMEGIALSLPVVVGAGGATRVVLPEMDEAERAGLDRSAAVLRAALAQVEAG
jgi:L-lactate dehydrogenase